MKETPIDYVTVKEVIDSFNLQNFGAATIREIVAIVNKIEMLTHQRYVRMEMGVPGLEASKIGVEAEINALKKGVASKYPMLDGLQELKKEASRFIKAFIDTDIESTHCVPVVGSMQGTFASFLTCCQANPKKNKILFIDPGFPVQKQQLKVLGYEYETFDVYDFTLYQQIDLDHIICLNEEELKIVGELANQYDVIVLEDLAYFAMDFRKNLSRPFEAPFQSTVARYTDHYIMLISSSKAFSYAGQRIGVVGISDKLYKRSYEGLEKRYGVSGFGNVFVNRVLYSLSSGTSHSAQYALAAMFKAANDGEFNFLNDVKTYAHLA